AQGPYAIRRHLGRLPAAVPAHHDDHRGGALRHFAHRARLWRGRRCATASWTGSSGRAGGEPVPDAVHHARDLPVSGARPGRDEAQRHGGGRAAAGDGAAMRSVMFALMLAGSLSAASVDGIPLHFSVTGKGSQTVLLVHGWTCDETSWSEQAAGLAGKYRIV